MKIPIIKSKKFTLRPFKKGDEESLAKNVNNKKIHKMVSNIQYPYSLENAKKWIKFNLNEYKKENHRMLILSLILVVRWQDLLALASKKKIIKQRLDIGWLSLIGGKEL